MWFRVVSRDPHTGQVEAGPRMNQAMAERMAGHYNTACLEETHYVITDEEWTDMRSDAPARAAAQ